MHLTDAEGTVVLKKEEDPEVDTSNCCCFFFFFFFLGGGGTCFLKAPLGHVKIATEKWAGIQNFLEDHMSAK